MASAPPRSSVFRSSWRIQFGIKHLLLGVAVVAIGLGIWTRYLRRIVDVRQAEPTDRVYERYFGFGFDDMKARNILIVTGSFTKSTWLSARLCHVKSGRVIEISALTIGRSPNGIGEGIVKDMRLTLALGDKETPAGHVTSLGSAGQSRGAGSGSGDPNDVTPVISLAIPGKVTPGREYIVYIEGDREPNLDEDPAFDEFAKNNNGNYLVVTLQLQ